MGRKASPVWNHTIPDGEGPDPDRRKCRHCSDYSCLKNKANRMHKHLVECTQFQAALPEEWKTVLLTIPESIQTRGIKELMLQHAAPQGGASGAVSLATPVRRRPGAVWEHAIPVEDGGDPERRLCKHCHVYQCTKTKPDRMHKHLVECLHFQASSPQVWKEFLQSLPESQQTRGIKEMKAQHTPSAAPAPPRLIAAPSAGATPPTATVGRKPGPMWEHAVIAGDGSDPDKRQCKHCNDFVCMKGKAIRMHKHLVGCTQFKLKCPEDWEKFLLSLPKASQTRNMKELIKQHTPASAGRSASIAPGNSFALDSVTTSEWKDEIDRAVMDLFSVDELPVRLVESPRFVRLLTLLRPSYRLPSQQGLVDLMEEDRQNAGQNGKRSAAAAGAVSAAAVAVPESAAGVGAPAVRGVGRPAKVAKTQAPVLTAAGVTATPGNHSLSL
jgi:hypothetical protein